MRSVGDEATSPDHGAAVVTAEKPGSPPASAPRPVPGRASGRRQHRVRHRRQPGLSAGRRRRARWPRWWRWGWPWAWRGSSPGLGEQVSAGERGVGAAPPGPRARGSRQRRRSKELENLVANALLIKARLGGCTAGPPPGSACPRGPARPRRAARGAEPGGLGRTGRRARSPRAA